MPESKKPIIKRPRASRPARTSAFTPPPPPPRMGRA